MQPENNNSPSYLDLMAVARSKQEAERTSVARRLHNEAGQSLAAFKMQCYLLDARVRAANPEIADELQAAISILDQAVSTVREVSEDLRPGSLRLGVDAAVEWQAERFQAQSDIACTVDIETHEWLVDESRAVELLRIFQEALANISLHSGTTIVEVSLRRESGGLLLEIRDDGVPPIPNESLEYSLGSLTMKERALRAGGSLEVVDSRIEVRLPLEPAAAEKG
jgi:signal transduction histidine kinase